MTTDPNNAACLGGTTPGSPNYTNDTLTNNGNIDSSNSNNTGPYNNTTTDNTPASADLPLNQTFTPSQSTSISTSYNSGTLTGMIWPTNLSYDSFQIFGSISYSGSVTANTAGFFYVNVKVYKTNILVEIEDNILCMIMPNSTQQKTLSLNYFYKIIPTNTLYTGPFKIIITISDIYNIVTSTLNLTSYNLNYFGNLNNNPT